MTRRTLSVAVDPCTFREPLRIAGRVFNGFPAMRVTLAQGDAVGRGEAGGVFYLGDDVAHMIAEVERVREHVVAGAERAALRTLLPPGGARNALDAALWDLESRQRGVPVWRLAGLPEPRPVVTTLTLGADDPTTLERALLDYAEARALKLKLDGDVEADAARLRLIHARRPDAWLMADANGGYDADKLEELMPVLVAADVKLLEQPFAHGDEAALDRLNAPIPIAADESLQGLDTLLALVGRFQVVNIKLDKCGGLTEALSIAREAQRLGLGTMVGNMGGSSLAAAPAYLLAQICDYVDLDGPRFLADDLPAGAFYADGRIQLSPRFWGSALASVTC